MHILTNKSLKMNLKRWLK